MMLGHNRQLETQLEPDGTLPMHDWPTRPHREAEVKNAIAPRANRRTAWGIGLSSPNLARSACSTLSSIDRHRRQPEQHTSPGTIRSRTKVMIATQIGSGSQQDAVDDVPMHVAVLDGRACRRLSRQPDVGQVLVE